MKQLEATSGNYKWVKQALTNYQEIMSRQPSYGRGPGLLILAATLFGLVCVVMHHVAEIVEQPPWLTLTLATFGPGGICLFAIKTQLKRSRTKDDRIKNLEERVEDLSSRLTEEKARREAKPV